MHHPLFSSDEFPGNIPNWKHILWDICPGWIPNERKRGQSELTSLLSCSQRGDRAVCLSPKVSGNDRGLQRDQRSPRKRTLWF